MGRKKPEPVAINAASEAVHTLVSSARPRLHKLRVSNFRCIGPEAVELELDDIVILVGPNNAGKSSLLRAYEVVMNHGSKEGYLSLEDFPNGKIDETRLPTIELETVVFDKTAPGETWVRTVLADDGTPEMFVREKWTWHAAGEPVKVGWDVAAGDWHASSGPWGAANVGNAHRPKPHSVTAFLNPSEQAGEVVELLKEAIKTRVKTASAKKKATEQPEQTDPEPSEYEKLLDGIKALQKTIADEAKTAVEDVRQRLGEMIADVFPGYGVTFDARAEDDVEKAVTLFKSEPVLKMGPDGGHHAALERQGSGACRTLLWAALRILAERPATSGKTTRSHDRPHLLLIDEPELCLHPDAIREACRVLYDLPKTKNWQVMITTHSPVFIDLSRDNTSICRVERKGQGTVHGTTIYRPSRAKLDPDDKAELKQLNLFDPYVAEFFFGGRTVLVEGDTEHTVFKWIISKEPNKYKDVHIIRARGKACISPLCKILNQFDKGYAVLHDADRETIVSKKRGSSQTNPAWTENSNILSSTQKGREAGRVRLVAAIPNFEEAFWGEIADGDKPYAALARVKRDDSAFLAVTSLLDALLDTSKALPLNAKAWSCMDSLAAEVAAFDGRPKPQLSLFGKQGQ